MARSRKTFWDYPSYERDTDGRRRWCSVFWTDRFVRAVDQSIALGRRARGRTLSAMQFPRSIARRLKRKLRSMTG